MEQCSTTARQPGELSYSHVWGGGIPGCLPRLCVDEKAQIQALDRTAPIRPMQPGLAGPPFSRPHPVWHPTLFAAMEIASAQVTGACRRGTDTRGFLAFLKQVARPTLTSSRTWRWTTTPATNIPP